MTLRRNILIFHLGALGDFIITWPLALTLARLYPQSRVFYVTHGQKGALAEKVLRVESLDIEGGWHTLFSESPALPEPATRALAGAHTVVSFLSDAHDAWANNVRQINPDANLIPLSTSPPESFKGHITEFVIQQLETLPAAHLAAQQILRSTTERGIAFPRIPGPILIHPGSGSPKKNWPAERFLGLIDRLKGDGRAVKVILGEVELERWPAELVSQFRASAEVEQPATLNDLLRVVSGASAFAGNDSGPAHLAGILGVPTLALIDSPNPNRWKPLGPRVRQINQPLQTMQMEDVYRAIIEVLTTNSAATASSPPE